MGSWQIWKGRQGNRVKKVFEIQEHDTDVSFISSDVLQRIDGLMLFFIFI